MYRLFVAIGGFIVLVLFTALIAPYFVDWTSYKKEFELQTSRIVGQKVEVLGKASMRLLPLPSITFGGLAIGKNADGTPMMTVDQFAMDVELLPLMKREISIVKLKLIRPRVNLFVDESGAVAWTDRKEITVDPEQIKLENFTITNGEIKIHGLAGGRTLSMEQLDGTLNAKSLYGPWRINADGYLAGEKTNLNIATGHLQEDGSIRLKLSANRADLPYSLSLDGPVQLREGLLHWDGKFEIGAKGDTALPIFSQGIFAATPRDVEIPEFRLEVGQRDDPYTITGKGSAKIGEVIDFNIQADGRQINLDQVAQKQNDESKTQGWDLKQRLDILREILEKVPVPPANGTIDISLPAIIAGDTVVREITALISPDGKGWKIKKLEAVFPGNTRLEAKGKIGLRNSFGFTGSMLVASRQPTGLAAWLGKRDNPYVRKLRSAGFRANVVISENQTSFENLELVLDKAVLHGKLQRLSANGKRPAMVARLEGKEINLDNLRAIYALIADERSASISNHDLDITLKAGTLTGFDISANDVETRFRVTNGSVSIEKLSASDFFGSSFSSSGRIDDVLNHPNGNFKLSVNAADGSQLLQFLKTRLPDNPVLTNLSGNPELTKNMQLDFEINARSSEKTVRNGTIGQASLKGQLAKTIIDVTAAFEGDANAYAQASLDVTSQLTNSNPTILLQQLAISALPLNVEGPLQINASITGQALSGFDTLVTAQAPKTKITAVGLYNPIGLKAGNANLKVTIDTKDMSELIALSSIPLARDSFTSNIPASFTGNIKYENPVIQISEGEGRIDAHEFNLNLNITKSATANHRINGNLKAQTLDLKSIAQLVLGTTATVQVDWNKSNFNPTLLQGFDGNIAIQIDQSNLGIAQPATQLTGTLALVDGSINLNQIEGQWLGGKLSADIALTNSQGNGNISAQYQLENADAKKLTNALQMNEFIGAKITILGSIEASGRSPAALISSLTGSGTADIKNAVISSINTNPLPDIFAVVDMKDFEILVKNLLPAVSKTISKGEISVPEISVPFIMAAGKLRARNISFEADGAKFRGSTEIDIAAMNMISQLSIRYDPKNQWVDGADPLIDISWNGQIAKPNRTIDAQPLSGYLSLRAFEKEQRRVDLLKAKILERQRLRRDVIITNARIRYRQRLKDEEITRQRQAILRKEEIRLQKLALIRHQNLLAVETIKRKEEDRIAREIERKRLEEEARIAAEKERLRLLEEAKIAAEEIRLRLEEEARIAIEKERLRLEEEIRQAAKAEKLRLQEEARLAAKAEEARVEALAEQLRLEKEIAEQQAIENERKRVENLPVAQTIPLDSPAINDNNLQSQ